MPQLKTLKPRRLTASVTELTGFQGCRRRWYLSRQWSTAQSSPKLYFGTGVHAGLEGYFKWKKLNPDDLPGQQKAMQEAFDSWAGLQGMQLKEEYGMLWDYAVESWVLMLELGREILDNYVLYDRQAEISLRPLMVERRLFIPMDENFPEPEGNGSGKRFVARALDVLTMRWDLLAETAEKAIAIVDHKTSSGGHASGATLDIDEQGTGYSYGFWRLFKRKRTADLFIYDVLAKKVPAEPRMLEPSKKYPEGHLSTAKDQDTTYAKMMAAIKARGEPVENFAELLYVLETKGWNSFFSREASPRNVDQLKNYEVRARMLFKDMRRVILDPRLAYPNPGTYRCPTCPFLQVCTSMEDGGNAQGLLDQNFTRHGKTPWTLPPRFKDMTG